VTDFSQYQHIGTQVGVEYYLVDGDIILIVPPKGFVDNADYARQSAELQDNYVRQLNKKCGDLVVMSNILGQDAATRRVYRQQAASGLYYGVALVVDSPLSRALSSFLIGMMAKNVIPMKVVDSIESGLAWLRMLRPQ
jgi:hypothetical protein